MAAQAHAFTYARDRWAEALERLPSLDTQARSEAVEHIRRHVHAVARSEGLSPADIGVFWQRGRPRLHIEDGPTADAEFGTLTQSPRGVIRAAAARADRSAAGLYRRRIWAGIQ